MAADDFDDVVDNVKRGSTWLRIVFMIGFCVVLYVVAVVIWFLTAGQALFSIFTGSDNRNLRLLGSSLAVYVNQILNFITYNAEYRPFPFNPFPEPVEADFTGWQQDDSDSGEWQEAAVSGDKASQGSGAGNDADLDSGQTPIPPSGGQFDDLAFLAREQDGGESEQQEKSPVDKEDYSEVNEGEGSAASHNDEAENHNNEDIEELLESVAEDDKEQELNTENQDPDNNKGNS